MPGTNVDSSTTEEHFGGLSSCMVGGTSEDCSERRASAGPFPDITAEKSAADGRKGPHAFADLIDGVHGLHVLRINSRLAARPSVATTAASVSPPDHSRPPPEPPATSSLPVARPATSAAASAASWNSQENSSAGHAFGQHYLSLVESDKARHRIYYVQLGIGTLPQTFNLDIGTGSNLLWLSCLITYALPPPSPCTSSLPPLNPSPHPPPNPAPHPPPNPAPHPPPNPAPHPPPNPAPHPPPNPAPHPPPNPAPHPPPNPASHPPRTQHILPTPRAPFPSPPPPALLSPAPPPLAPFPGPSAPVPHPSFPFSVFSPFPLSPRYLPPSPSLTSCSPSLPHSRPFSPSCINPDRTVKIRNCNVTAKPLAKGSAAGSAGGSGEDLGCMYSVAYGDGSGTSGRLLGDVIHLPISGSARAFKVPITFGCGNSQQGNFYNGLGWTYYQALDGLIGLGRGSLSLLTAVGAYKEFFPIRQVVAHCLGGDGGGGWMTVGDLPIPPLTAFTPLRPDETFYKVTLRKVFVGGIEVAVNPAQYGNLTHGNAIFDSGTTYSIMPPLFVPPLFHLIQTAVGLPRYPFSIGKEGSLCFSSTDELTAEDVRNRFPHINLQFEGRGVFMNLPPHTYTFKAMDEGVEIVCTQVVLGSDTMKAPHGLAFIIGALWMRDFLVIHDQEDNRVGWAAMKCT
ncbi:unnamed protein product [Closterium sp. NIES-65]|nr:unnamed protein product [Closterium sp. NIES-65]